MTQSTPIDDKDRPPDPVIPGIYNYCDRWCERCAFSRQCHVFRDVRIMTAALERGDDPAPLLDAIALAECEEADRNRTPEERAEWDAFLEQANMIPTERDLADVDAWLRRRDAWIETQTIRRDSHEYGRLAVDLCTPAQVMLPAGDEVARTAVDTVLHLSLLIPAKVYRALTGLGAAVNDFGKDDDSSEDFGEMSDANGSAKVVRLAIAESRDAWAVLRALPGLDGVAASMIRRLSDMDAEIARLFPAALAFVRPGFDDGGASSWE